MAKYNYRKSTGESSVALARNPWADRPHMPYILPYLAYILCMAPASFKNLGGIDWATVYKQYMPLESALKSGIAALLIWYFWPWFTRIRWTHLGLGVLAGLFGTVLWVGSEYACQYLNLVKAPDEATHLYLFKFLAGNATIVENPKIYNPDLALGGGIGLTIFLCIRVAGPALVVPFMEELLFRDFIQRMFIRNDDFQQVPIGTFSWVSLIGMCVLFGINHGYNYFVPGFLYGLLMGLLLIRTKSLGSCIVAHGITNWTLYLYCIYTGDWQFM